MNKILSKTVRKTTLLATIFTVILAAAIVVCALFGFQKDTTLTGNNTLTVTVNTFAYNNQKDEIIDECESVFGSTQCEYVVEGNMAGDSCELIFVFDKKTDVQALDTALTARFAEIQANAEHALSNAEISVSTAVEKTASVWAKGFALRSSLALVVGVALVFAYAAIRYKKWTVGVAAACSVAAAMLLSGALIVLTRAYVTATLPMVVALSGMMTAATVFFTYGKIRAAQKEDPSTSNEAAVLSSIPAKGILWSYGALAVAAIVLGIVGRTAVAWFAVNMLLALVASAGVALFLAPAVYLSLREWTDGKPQKDAYVGAKKTSTKKAKQAEAVAETPVEEASQEEAEAPQEEPQEEAEEASVEEVSEEVEEAPQEEAPEEEQD